MKLEMHARGVDLSERLRTHIERRFRFALTRFDARLRRVHVLVEDVNGPRGGRDIRCRIRASLSDRGELVIRELDRDPFAAVARAAERVGHAVSRRLERHKARRRGRVRGPALAGGVRSHRAERRGPGA